jgi:Icc-related predicted phosphoesterase
MLVLGDAHADEPRNRRALHAAYRESDADVALQVGDLLHYDLPAPTYFVAGNNEDHDTIAALRHGLVEHPGVRNAHLLHSTAADIHGLRVAGLSGNYAPSQHHKPRRALDADRRRHFTAADVERAKRLDDVDVLLVHEAPNGLPVAENYDVGCHAIDDLFDALQPPLCLVGHHHEHVEATIDGTRVVSLAPAWESYYTLDEDTLELERFETPEG